MVSSRIEVCGRRRNPYPLRFDDEIDCSSITDAFVDDAACPPSTPLPKPSIAVSVAPYTFWVDDAESKSPRLVQGELQAQRGCDPRLIAAKMVCTKDLPAFLEKEGRVLHILHNHGHPNIPKLRATVATKDHSFVVIDQVKQCLSWYVAVNGRLPERQARHAFRQIASAVAHCHKHNILLRQLRPDKIFISDADSFSVVIADLDGATMAQTDVTTETGPGPAFNCPEVARPKTTDGIAVDSWALGVVLFYMLTGAYPLIDHARHNGVPFPSFVSFGARRLIIQLLDFNPRLRPTAANIPDDPWMDSMTQTYSDSHPIGRSAKLSVLGDPFPTNNSTNTISTATTFISSRRCVTPIAAVLEDTFEPDQLVPSVEPAAVERSDSTDVDSIEQTPQPQPLSHVPVCLGGGLWSSTKSQTLPTLSSTSTLAGTGSKRRAEENGDDGLGSALRRRLTVLERMTQIV